MPLFVGLVGISPHLFYSFEKGELSFFKLGYDEDTYAERALEQSPRSDRFLSSSIYRATYNILGADHNLPFLLFDFVFPFLLTFLALLFARFWTPSKLIQCLFATAVVMGQELFSFGSNIVWPSEWAPWNVLSSASAYQKFIPYYSTTFFSIYRSPEPQFSLCIALAFFCIWSSFLKSHERSLIQNVRLAIATLSVSFTYVFVGVPLGILSFTLSVYLFFKKNKSSGITIFLSLVLGLVGKFLIDSQAPNGHLGFIFASRLPDLAPSLFYSILGCLAFVKWRAQFQSSIQQLFFLIAMALPLFLLNQQLISGIMVSPRDFEVNINYLLIAVGALGLFAKQIKISQKWRWPVVALLASLGLTFLFGQYRTYKSWYFHNEVSYEYLKLLKSAGATGTRILIKDSPETAPLIRIRNNSPMQFVLNFNSAQDHLVEDMIEEELPPKGRDKHLPHVFEYFARLSFSPLEFSQILREEILRKKGYFYLPFLFSIKDSWYPLTDSRLVKTDWVLNQIDNLEKAYGDFVTNFMPIESVYILTQSPISKSGSLAFISLVSTSALPYGNVAYLYRQGK